MWCQFSGTCSQNQKYICVQKEFNTLNVEARAFCIHLLFCLLWCPGCVCRLLQGLRGSDRQLAVTSEISRTDWSNYAIVGLKLDLGWLRKAQYEFLSRLVSFQAQGFEWLSVEMKRWETFKWRVTNSRSGCFYRRGLRGVVIQIQIFEHFVLADSVPRSSVNWKSAVAVSLEIIISQPVVGINLWLNLFYMTACGHLK